MLNDVFSRELIKIGLESKDKEEVFEEMADFFCQTTGIKSRQEILTALWEREAKMSTGIKRGIAVPHGKSSVLKNVYGVLGVSKKGIEYDSLDSQPVNLVFMILVPDTDSEAHLRILKRLAQIIDNHEFYSELLAQNNPRNASDIIKKYEEIYIASD
jgi:PTS system fructose-specific IIC component/PTS system nitrogen regulatory IIA component